GRQVTWRGGAGGATRHEPVATLQSTVSIDVFEQFDDALDARYALNQAGRPVSFLACNQAQQIDDSVLGDDLDSRAGDVLVRQHLRLDLGGQPGVVAAGQGGRGLQDLQL